MEVFLLNIHTIESRVSRYIEASFLYLYIVQTQECEKGLIDPVLLRQNLHMSQKSGKISLF